MTAANLHGKTALGSTTQALSESAKLALRQ
jgi:hypothetical protein